MTSPETPIHPGGGLSTREHFAALAMQGLLAESLDDMGFSGYSRERAEAIAGEAVRIADALIDALNRPREAE